MYLSTCIYSQWERDVGVYYKLGVYLLYLQTGRFNTVMAVNVIVHTQQLKLHPTIAILSPTHAITAPGCTCAHRQKSRHAELFYRSSL